MTVEAWFILAIAVTSTISAMMVLHEYLTDRAARKAAEKEIRERDMISRKERLKRELIEHNREQLALEYLNKKGAKKNA